jgi:hypothetical protein
MTADTATDLASLPLVFNYFQLAYVTPDLERAQAACRELYGIGRFQTSFEVPIETRRGEARVHFAIAFAGLTQIELIQPVGGADRVYRDGLPTDGAPLRLHHMGHLIKDGATWRMLMERMSRTRLELPIGGTYSYDGVPWMHYVYVDARKALGHYLEFMYQTEAGKDIFGQVPRF